MSSEAVNKAYYDSYWNENMIEYLSHSSGVRWFDHLLNLTLKHIPQARIHSVADVGCGLGLKTARFARYFLKAQVYGYDFSRPGIEAAKRYHKLKNLHLVAQDITAKDLGKTFDLITAFDVLEHVKDWQGLTKKLIAINTGYVIFSSPVGRMRPYEKHIGHFRNFKKYEIERFMERHGYRTIKAYYAGFPFYSPIIRDLTNIFYKNYRDLPQSKMSFLGKRFHDIWYFLFRYCSMYHKGDIFVGLFEKIPAEENKRPRPITQSVNRLG